MFGIEFRPTGLLDVCGFVRTWVVLEGDEAVVVAAVALLLFLAFSALDARPTMFEDAPQRAFETPLIVSA